MRQTKMPTHPDYQHLHIITPFLNHNLIDVIKYFENLFISVGLHHKGYKNNIQMCLNCSF